MTECSTAILGGGLAGLSAAYHLKGEAAVFEQQSTVGGLCRQLTAGAFRFDAVPHVFHFRRADTLQLVQRLLGHRLRSYPRQARVYSHGTVTRYPFQAHLYGLPPSVIDECLAGRTVAARNGHPHDATFQEWIEARFGKGIAKHFMVPYNTKFWTLPPTELTCEWVEGLVPVPTLAQTQHGALVPDPAEYGYNVTFWYPDAGGLGTLLEAFVRDIPQLHLGKRLTRIDLSARQLHFADGEIVRYERLLSSIPLPELAPLLGDVPRDVAAAFAALRWTSIAVAHLAVKGPAPHPWHWVYVPDPDIVFYRVGIPSHYAPDAAPAGYYLLSAEMSYSTWQPLAREGLWPRILQDLMRLGLLRSVNDVDVQLLRDLRYGYPIYDRNYAWAIATIRTYLEEQKVTLLGRSGSWRYLSVEDSLLEGQRAAAQAAEAADHGTVLH